MVESIDLYNDIANNVSVEAGQLCYRTIRVSYTDDENYTQKNDETDRLVASSLINKVQQSPTSTMTDAPNAMSTPDHEKMEEEQARVTAADSTSPRLRSRRSSSASSSSSSSSSSSCDSDCSTKSTTTKRRRSRSRSNSPAAKKSHRSRSSSRSNFPIETGRSDSPMENEVSRSSNSPATMTGNSPAAITGDRGGSSREEEEEISQSNSLMECSQRFNQNGRSPSPKGSGKGNRSSSSCSRSLSPRVNNERSPSPPVNGDRSRSATPNEKSRSPTPRDDGKGQVQNRSRSASPIETEDRSRSASPIETEDRSRSPSPARNRSPSEKGSRGTSPIENGNSGRSRSPSSRGPSPIIKVNRGGKSMKLMKMLNIEKETASSPIDESESVQKKSKLSIAEKKKAEKPATAFKTPRIPAASKAPREPFASTSKGKPFAMSSRSTTKVGRNKNRTKLSFDKEKWPSAQVIRKMLHKSGISRISACAVNVFRCVLYNTTKVILRDAILYMGHEKKKTLMTKHIHYALTLRNLSVLGWETFDQPVEDKKSLLYLPHYAYAKLVRHVMFNDLTGLVEGARIKRGALLALQWNVEVFLLDLCWVAYMSALKFKKMNLMGFHITNAIDSGGLLRGTPEMYLLVAGDDIPMVGADVRTDSEKITQIQYKYAMRMKRVKKIPDLNKKENLQTKLKDELEDALYDIKRRLRINLFNSTNFKKPKPDYN